MKNQSIYFIILGIIVLSSCKKSYQCDCSHTDAYGNYTNTESNTYKERKRETAQEACEAKSNVTAVDIKKCVIVN